MTARRTWRRWAYLVAGGALLLPYWLLSMTVIGPLPVALAAQLVLMLVVLPVAGTFLTGLVPAVRSLEGAAARELLGGPLAALPASSGRAFGDRVRTAVWYTAHLHVGVVVSAISLAVPPFAVVTMFAPWNAWTEPFVGPGPGKWGGWAWVAIPAGLATLAGVLALIVGAGAGLARLAPRLLGPSPAERVAELEAAATRLAERNRLARDLHDSVGHALSVVTLQAAAAGRVLATDPAFAREALGAIEETSRAALEDLDHVLGLLREDAPARAPQLTLGDLPRLLDQTRIAGVSVAADVDPGLARVPAAVSREAYRIVQEGLTNALKHAGKVPVRVRVAVRGDRLEMEIDNPLGEREITTKGGGRGLSGVRERVSVLRGTVDAGPSAEGWHLHVVLPLGPSP